MALINVDVNDSEQIELFKKQYKLLQARTIACLSSGFVILLSSPFVVKAKDNPFLRYASLFCSLVFGSVSLVSIKRLEEIEPQYTVIKKAETRTFINKSATSEFTLMKLFEREAFAILTPTQPVEPPHSQSDSQPSQSDSQSDSQPSIEDNSPDSLTHSHFAANASASASVEQLNDQRSERFELLRQLKKNRRTKAQMIERLWGVTEENEEYSYYASKLEEMLADLKRLDSES